MVKECDVTLVRNVGSFDVGRSGGSYKDIIATTKGDYVIVRGEGWIDNTFWHKNDIIVLTRDINRGAFVTKKDIGYAGKADVSRRSVV